AYLLERLAVGLGGRAAEELACADITSGAQNDLQQVTRIARAMVTQLGMADELGPEYFGGDDGLPGQPGGAGDGAHNPWAPREYSDATARRIDAAVHRLIDEAHHRARSVLSENRATLDAIAVALLREESLSREELTDIVNAHCAPGQEPLPVPTGPPTEYDERIPTPAGIAVHAAEGADNRQ
ncbi:MAG TPA: cell division protein FtsH, partial [Chloroflexota bacterium]|nr:cell division protein FtsH [Chloroflexota bacterium]